MQNQRYKYIWKQYRIRTLVQEDVERCAIILNGKVTDKACKSISGASGIVLEVIHEDEYKIVGFATWEIEEGLVSVPVGFVINYKLSENDYIGPKGSLLLSLVLFAEKLGRYPIYTSSSKPDTFIKMFNEKYVHGRSNKMFRFYRLKNTARDRIMKMKDKIQWEVNTEQ